MHKKNVSYTIEELAALLKVSKLTIYDLIKKGELPAYRVGRQMRVDDEDLAMYKSKTREESRHPLTQQASQTQQPADSAVSQAKSVIISGQDISLDILASHMEQKSKLYRPLRSYVGSLNSLISMYMGECDVVSTHLFDGDTGEYNIPFIRKILVGQSYVVVNLVSRWTGFFVKKGNPQNIHTWNDLTRPDVTIVNREKGAGARVLLDEQLRIHGISKEQINGYSTELSSHLNVAGAIAKGEADVGVGIEKVASIVDVEFIPLQKERYDLVMLKTPENLPWIELVADILHSPTVKAELAAIGGYDLTLTGQVMYES